jgi:tetratricopeptide (TPR) repeat protein
MRLNAVLLLILVLFLPTLAAAQSDAVTDARSAIASAEYPRAINLLTQAIAQQPSADAYLYLGIAYGHTRDWSKAEETLKQGSNRYPQDPRFHNELAGVYLAGNDLDKARESLRFALQVDPQNKYAIDLLATVDMSMGNVQAAIASWNKDGRPVVGNILQNTHLELENWSVGKAIAFHKGEKLTWSQWKTTEARLLQSELYANVGLEIEPTQKPDTYTVVIRTGPKSQGVDQYVITLLEAAFFESPKVRFWNIGNSGISLSAGYRYAVNRHLGDVEINAPLPLPGMFFEGRGVFRSERWDISRPAIDNGTDYRFLFQSTGFRAMVKSIPHYRVSLGAGFEYRNRTAHGALPAALAVDSRNTGKMLFEANVLPVDTRRYDNRIHGELFAARKNILGDMNYSGGTVELNNRYAINTSSGMNLDVTLKGGSSRGQLPIDDYFVLGLRQSTDNFLRGHNAVSHRGHFGHAPMGTSFALLNTTLDHRMRRFQVFNLLNVPFADLKWQVFADAGKSWDRAHVFNQGKLLVDVGGGFKLETPTRVFNVTYGRSLRDGTATLAAYVQKRW